MQIRAIEAAGEVTLMVTWFRAEFPHEDPPPAGRLDELRRWAQQSSMGFMSLLGGGAGVGGHRSGVATAVNSDDDDDGAAKSNNNTHNNNHQGGAGSSHPPSGRASATASHVGSLDMAEMPEMLHMTADEDPITGFIYTFFDRLELVYGVVCALEKMAAINLTAPFPLATALPYIDAVIDHAGSLEFEWDKPVLAYLNDTDKPKITTTTDSSRAAGASGGSKTGITSAAAAANITAVPLQLNFESPYVAELLRYVADGVREAALLLEQEGGAVTSPKLTNDSLSEMNLQAAMSAGSGNSPAAANLSLASPLVARNRSIAFSPSSSYGSPSGTTLLRFKIQMAGHVERIKSARRAKRQQWALLAPPPATKVSMLQSFASTSLAAQMAAAPPPPVPCILPNNAAFSPIWRRCKNFRGTVHRYLAAVRRAAMVVFVQLADLEENRRSSLVDNKQVFAAKAEYARRIEDMVSFVDETAAWMPDALHSAVKLENAMAQSPSVSGAATAGGEQLSTMSVRVLADRMQRHLVKCIEKNGTGGNNSSASVVHDLCIVARLSETTAKLARVAITAVRRRALLDSPAGADDGDEAANGIVLLTSAYAACATDRLERLIAHAVAAPRSSTTFVEMSHSPMSMSRSFGGAFNDSLFGGPAMSEDYERSDLRVSAEEASSARTILAALRGSELRDRLNILRAKGVSVYFVRRWEVTQTGYTNEHDPFTTIRLHPVDVARHTVKLSDDCAAFEFWKPGGRQPTARLGLAELASVDADGGPQYSLRGPHGEILGRAVRLTLGRLMTALTQQQQQPADSIALARSTSSRGLQSPVMGAQEPSFSGISFATPPAAASMNASEHPRRPAYKLNNRFELVPDHDYDPGVDAGPTTSGGGAFRLTGDSGHFSPRDSFIARPATATRRQPQAGDEAPDGELPSPIGAAKPNRGGFTSTAGYDEASITRSEHPQQKASYGLRAIMSQDTYSLTRNAPLNPERASSAAAMRAGRPETITFILPSTLGYSEWLSLFRDVLRFAPIVPSVLEGFGLDTGDAFAHTPPPSDDERPPRGGGGGLAFDEGESDDDEDGGGAPTRVRRRIAASDL
jgi:hypothetical protein